MNYIESIKDHPLTNFWNSLPLMTLSRDCRKAICLHLTQVETLRDVVNDIEQQINEWEEWQLKDKSKDFSKNIAMFSKVKDFYEDNGKLLMIELDVTESFLHLISSKDDWEYRFFVRRIFTLMHETRDALLSKLGSHRSQMQTLAPTTFDQYEKSKSSIDRFLNDHGVLLKNVRNTTEAHKGEPFRDQLQCIEQLEVTSTFEMIHSFQTCMANLSTSLMILMPEISKGLGKLLVISSNP